jgi:hypothetical protein
MESRVRDAHGELGLQGRAGGVDPILDLLGADVTVGNGAAPLGALLGGALATSIGLRSTLLTAGGILALAATVLLPYLMRSRDLR